MVELFIADELHMLGGGIGFTYEIIVSRMHQIAVQAENPMRIVAFSASLSKARDLGEWIGADKYTTSNFTTSSRPTPLEIHIQSYGIPHFPSMMSMANPI